MIDEDCLHVRLSDYFRRRREAADPEAPQDCEDARAAEAPAPQDR